MNFITSCLLQLLSCSFGACLLEVQSVSALPLLVNKLLCRFIPKIVSVCFLCAVTIAFPGQLPRFPHAAILFLAVRQVGLITCKTVCIGITTRRGHSALARKRRVKWKKGEKRSGGGLCDNSQCVERINEKTVRSWNFLKIRMKLQIIIVSKIAFLLVVVFFFRLFSSSSFFCLWVVFSYFLTCSRQGCGVIGFLSFCNSFNFENYVELFNWSLKQKITIGVTNLSYWFQVFFFFSHYKMNNRVIALMKLFIGNQVMESFEIFEIEKLVQNFCYEFRWFKKNITFL